MAWQSLFSDVALALVAPILAVGVAALANNLLRARRQMWERLVQDKVQRTDDFLGSMRPVAEQLQLISWLHTTHGLENISDKFSNFALLLERLREQATPGESSKIEFMQEQVLPNYWPSPEREGESRERARALTTGIHNLLITRFMAAQQAVQDAYAHLSMVAYDPSKAATLKSHVVKMVDQLGKQFPGKEPAPIFDKIYQDFREAQRYAIAYLRMDIRESYKRFSKAKNVCRKWLDERPKQPPTPAVR